ncbi:hypothetical protein Gotri_024887 [Gossypium trilobum]|uniref:Uncharacterized protein n=1 Tax=Gossypium trilobum TaxID=34281 RepID=A0A7J9FWR4_9ROSI|nr:hypothetical protein [Gossypium trilobum]
MRPFKYGSKKHNKRRVTVWRRGTCRNYDISPTSVKETFSP